MIKQFIKYCAVGGSGVLVNGAFYFGLLSIGLHHSIAWFAGVGTSVVSNFLLNRYYTFEAHKIGKR